MTAAAECGERELGVGPVRPARWLAPLALAGLLAGQAGAEQDRAAAWAKCIGLLDAIALLRYAGEVNGDWEDLLTAAVPNGWHEGFEIREDMPYGEAWLEVRAAATRGLEALAGPDRLPALTVVQLAEFAATWLDVDELLATDGPSSLWQLTPQAPECFDLYDELVKEGVIRP